MDFYQILGVSRHATINEIKKAYREKARETHPDKNPSKDAEVSALEFHKVVEAFETLSDPEARDKYNRFGFSASNQNSRRASPNSNNDFQSFQNEWNFHFFHQQHQPNYHRFLYQPMMRAQILDAQSRTVTITSLDHLKTIATGIDDSENFEKIVFLAMYDGSKPNCLNKLHNQLIFPWPFAGYSREGEGKIWWPEILIAAKIDVSKVMSTQGHSEKPLPLQRLLMYYPGAKKMIQESCMAFVLHQRGSRIESNGGQGREEREGVRSGNREKGREDLISGVSSPIGKGPTPSTFSDADALQSWVWQSLQMTVTVVNRTPWVIHHWWLDGMVGKQQPDISPGAAFILTTFISHTFHFRASHVEGRTLTDGSALLTYTSRIQDDSSTVQIFPRCFDLSGECDRWRQEGFCDPSRETFYTLQNPGFRSWVMENCRVACGKGCPSPS